MPRCLGRKGSQKFDREISVAVLLRYRVRSLQTAKRTCRSEMCRHSASRILGKSQQLGNQLFSPSVRKFSLVRSCSNVHPFRHHRSERGAPNMTSAMRARVPGVVFSGRASREKKVRGNLGIEVGSGACRSRSLIVGSRTPAVTSQCPSGLKIGAA